MTEVRVLMVWTSWHLIRQGRSQHSSGHHAVRTICNNSWSTYKDKQYNNYLVHKKLYSTKFITLLGTCWLLNAKEVTFFHFTPLSYNKQLLDEVFVISRTIKVEVRVNLIILDITKTESNNCFIIHWTQKLGSHVSASSLTASSTNRAKLAWLPLEISGLKCPWHDNCIICSYDVTDADFENSLYAFGQSEKS